MPKLKEEWQKLFALKARWKTVWFVLLLIRWSVSCSHLQPWIFHCPFALGSPGLSKVPLSKPAVGQSSIALHAVPAYRASINLVSAFPAHSTSFSQISSILKWGKCVLNSESEFSLVVGIHFVSPWYDPSWLTGCKSHQVSIYPVVLSVMCDLHVFFNNNTIIGVIWPNYYYYYYEHFGRLI